MGELDGDAGQCRQWRGGDRTVDRQQPAPGVQLHDGSSDGGQVLVPPLVGRVHREEPEDEEVHGRGDDGEAEDTMVRPRRRRRGRGDDGETDQNKEDAERDVVEPSLLRVLQSHKVTEADRCKRDDAVVDRVKVRPALVPVRGPLVHLYEDSLYEHSSYLYDQPSYLENAQAPKATTNVDMFIDIMINLKHDR